MYKNFLGQSEFLKNWNIFFSFLTEYLKISFVKYYQEVASLAEKKTSSFQTFKNKVLLQFGKKARENIDASNVFCICYKL